MDLIVPAVSILDWLKNILYEPVSNSFSDWIAIKSNKKFCKKNGDLFAINKRVTEHIIYKDGTLILYSKYYIEMLQDGDFILEKGYGAVSPNTDLTKINHIYTSFKDIKKDRFRNYLLVTEIQEKINRDVSVFKSELLDVTSNLLKYKINYTNLKKGDKFSFCISITIPKEFSDVSNMDEMLIKYNYGIYEFISKIDKQHPLSNKFSPICKLENNLEPSSKSNIYYTGFKWIIRNPKEGKIELKFI